MIDPVSYLVLILMVLGLSHATLGFSFSPINRFFWCVTPGIGLLFIAHQSALFFALLAIAVNVIFYVLCKAMENARLKARLPYLILLLLFVPDALKLFQDAPILWLGSAFFVVRQMMTTTQAVKKNVEMDSYLPGLLLATFFFAAIPSGPIFNGLDVLKKLKERRDPDYAEGGYRIFEGFVYLFAIAGFASMAVGELRALEAQPINVLAFGALYFVLTPLVSFGFLFATFYGYSRMAEGTALVLGFSVPENFNKPHLATDLGDYWKRWHRSMADFVMQYIYLPLIVTTSNAKIALVCAFVFMGLWHDFSLNFLIWGLGHGLALGYGLPWIKKHGVPPFVIRVGSLAYVVFLSSIAHRVWMI